MLGIQAPTSGRIGLAGMAEASSRTLRRRVADEAERSPHARVHRA
ncbi:ABC transporter [Cutibacterium acnes JCM 18918]|nr:ABC transporter [Cutibacterium acnes JCM 18918]